MPLKPGQKSKRNLIYKCSVCGNLQAMMVGEKAPLCEICNENHKVNEWLETSKELLLMSKNVKREIEKRKTLTDKISDRITNFSGSMAFVYLHIAWFALWIIYNLDPNIAFDPYPFGLLTLIVSLEAIILATFILVSQSRQGDVFDQRAELDYQIDIKSEKNSAEILALLSKIYSMLKKDKK